MSCANSETDPRTMAPRTDRRFGRRRCLLIDCCPRPTTHIGLANGMGMTIGCEWHVRMWVKQGARMFTRRGAQ